MAEPESIGAASAALAGVAPSSRLPDLLKAGADALDAVIHASVTRVRPVCMTAVTTILGMVPLLFDAFFKSMAAVIMFGLGFATILTLIVVPVLYTLAYRMNPPRV